VTTEFCTAVLDAHRTNYGPDGWSCTCGNRYGQPENVEQAIQMHHLAAVECATRELVAQDIEDLVAETERRLETARVEQRPDRIVKYKVVAATARHAARIARGGDA